MNMIENSSSRVRNNIRVMSYSIAVESRFLFCEIHSKCHCVYVTVLTAVVHNSHVMPFNEIFHVFGQDSLSRRRHLQVN